MTSRRNASAGGSSGETSRCGWLIWLIAALAALAVVVWHGDFGVTWDEGIQAEYGEQALDYYASLGRDTRANETANLRYYGAAVEMLASGVARLRPSAPYETRHLVVGLLTVLAIPALAWFASLYRRPRLAVFAALALVMLPRFTGHALNNSKDAPFALGVILFMAAASSFLIDGPRSWKRAIVAGLAFGFALAIRPGGFVILALFTLGIATLSRMTHPTGETAGRGRYVAAMFGIAWAVLYVSWPYAHAHPLGSIVEATRSAAAFFEAPPLLFDGRFVSGARLPWYYVPWMFLMTIPPLILLFSTLGVGIALRDAVRTSDARQRALHVILLMWLSVPITLVMVLRPPQYDGLRHSLFVLPAVATLAAVGAAWLCERLSRRVGSRFATGLLVILILLPVKDLVRLHPYQTTYYNLFGGGMDEAETRWETDYWISSYREAMDWINLQARDREGPVRVLTANLPVPTIGHMTDGGTCWLDELDEVPRTGFESWVMETAAHRAAANVETVSLADHFDARGARPADYYLATTRFGYDRCFPYAPIVHRVGRAGATYAVVRDLRQR